MAGAGGGGAPDDRVAALILAARHRGLRDHALMAALEAVPRAAFAPEPLASEAHRDIALPLPCGQTMSAPLEVAAVVQALAIGDGNHVLEIGTGSGYQAALMAALGARVVSLERYRTLAAAAESRFARLRIRATVLQADGLAFLPERPFDRIVLNGAVSDIPRGLLAALATGGCLLAPVTDGATQHLRLIRRERDGGLTRQTLWRTRLHPLVQGIAAAL